MKKSIKAKSIIFVLVFFLSSCAVFRVPVLSGGSRSDGLVEFTYEYGIFQNPKVDFNSSIRESIRRCAGWGYKSAEVFGGPIRTCADRGALNGCNRYRETIRYQCTN